MARISEQSIEKVRQAADIIEVVSGYVELKQKGRNFFGLCPFHSEKTPSFSVNPEKQIYKCFGCGSGGGAINFIMEIENLEFPDAIKHLAQNFNIVLDIQGGDSKKFLDLKSQLLAIHEIASNYYFESLFSQKNSKALNYLKERGFNKETIEKFKVGFSPDSYDDLLSILRKESFSADAMKSSGLFIKSEKNYFNRFRSRIMFPIHNYKGNVIGFGGRIFNKDDPAKYQNSPDTPIYNKSNVLYGLYQNAQFIREKNNIILVEGYMDLLQLFQAGINNCLAISGTAFTNGHAMILKRYTNNIYVSFDGDNAGRKASLRCGYILISNTLNPKIISPPANLDPDDWIREKGKDDYIQGIKDATDIIKSHYNYFSSTQPQGSLNINDFIQECLNELINVKDPIIQELMVKKISELTSIDQKNILYVFNQKKEKRTKFKNIDKTDNKNKEVIVNQDYPLKLYDDLIRLCFSKEKNIRKFLFDNLAPDWIFSDIHKEIYNQIFVHLKSEEFPPVNILVEQINDKSIRQKIIDLTYNLNTFEPNYSMAVDCLIRLEQHILKDNVEQLRQKLKNLENEDNVKILDQLSSLEKKVVEIENKYKK